LECEGGDHKGDWRILWELEVPRLVQREWRWSEMVGIHGYDTSLLRKIAIIMEMEAKKIKLKGTCLPQSLEVTPQ
jgi:hypothetical protein